MSGSCCRQFGKVDQRVGGGVARADHEDPLAGEPCTLAAQDVRQRGGNPLRGGRFARAGSPEVPSGLRVSQVPEASMTPAARYSRTSPAACSTLSRNGVVSRPRLWVLSIPEPRHRHDAGAGVQPGAMAGSAARGARYGINEIAAEGQRRGPRCLPAGRGEQPGGGSVDVEPPGREEADVAPLLDGGARRRAGLKNQRLEAALQEVGRRGEADRARSDDGNGKIGAHSHCVLCPNRLIVDRYAEYLPLYRRLSI